MKAAGTIGGVYLAGRYIRDRLEEVKDKVLQERLARDRCVWGKFEVHSVFSEILPISVFGEDSSKIKKIFRIQLWRSCQHSGSRFL